MSSLDHMIICFHDHLIPCLFYDGMTARPCAKKHENGDKICQYQSITWLKITTEYSLNLTKCSFCQSQARRLEPRPGVTIIPCGLSVVDFYPVLRQFPADWAARPSTQFSNHFFQRGTTKKASDLSKPNMCFSKLERNKTIASLKTSFKLKIKFVRAARNKKASSKFLGCAGY